MNSLTSSSNIQHSNIFDLLHDHENFTIDWIKIYPELVECAEHFVLACTKNPWFASKIINAEYDLLIWDDVSGRPITLMIKYILDHYRKQKWINKNIKCIYIDDPKKLSDKYITAINQKYSNKLIITENILWWTTIDKLNKSFELTDIFAQVTRLQESWPYNNYHKIIYWIFAHNDYWDQKYNYFPKIEWHSNMKLHLWLNSIYGKNWFSGKIPEHDPHLALAYREQIKLLSNYIIKNYLKT